MAICDPLFKPLSEPSAQAARQECWPQEESKPSAPRWVWRGSRSPGEAAKPVFVTTPVGKPGDPAGWGCLAGGEPSQQQDVGSAGVSGSQSQLGPVGDIMGFADPATPVPPPEIRTESGRGVAWHLGDVKAAQVAVGAARAESLCPRLELPVTPVPPKFLLHHQGPCGSPVKF